jgi:hypothetical protein
MVLLFSVSANRFQLYLFEKLGFHLVWFVFPAALVSYLYKFGDFVGLMDGFGSSFLEVH